MKPVHVNRVLYILSFAIISTCTISAAIPDPVRLDSGSVSGNSADDAGVRSFKGIPFAAPPLGELRWRAPQPAAHWDGVRKAEQFSPNCTTGAVGRGGA
jgi:para-nitrobenzyl esterase